MEFSITVLGSSSAVPSKGRSLPAVLVKHVQDLILIDCGEGTQFRLKENHARLSRLRYIFISHLHGDHFFGLIGLLSTLNLYGRKDPLYIFSPEGLEPLIMAQLKVSDSELNYPVHFEVISEKGSKLLVQAKRYSIEAFPLDHRIETYGFLIKEKKRERSIIKEKIIGEDIPVQFFNEIKAGKDFIRQDGSILRNDSITEPGIPVRSFAYCSDTKYNESLIEHIEGCDLLLHEATFTNEFADLAESRFHSTAEQAGKIASKAKVKKMLISHFSARYETTDLLLEEAKKSFENTIVAPENIKISL